MDYSEYSADAYPARHRHRAEFRPYPKISADHRRLYDEIRTLDSRTDRIIPGADDHLDIIREAYASNIHWSTRLEGNRLSLEQVDRITGLFIEGAEQEIGDGHSREVLNHLRLMFGDNRCEPPWTTELICDVHHALMHDVDPDTVPGEMRTELVNILGTDDFVYFIACPPTDIRDQLALLLEWLNGSPFDPVCTATVFLHEFESIHPFKDGNGRTGRFLFQMIIQELGLRNCGLCRFEQNLLQDPDRYYALLSYTDSTGDYYPFICYTAEAIYRSYLEALDDFSEKDRLKDHDETTRFLAFQAKKVRSFDFQTAHSWVSYLSEQSVRRKLNDLIDLQILRKHGMTRSVVYEFNDPVQEIRCSVTDRSSTD